MRSTRKLLAWAALAALGLGGCELVAGLGGDATLTTAGSGGGTGGGNSSSSSSGTTSSSSGSTSSSSGTGGTGGIPQNPTFAFAITDATVSVPYGGTTFVNLSVTPTGGFDAPIDVTAPTAPNGLTVQPLTIPAGATKAQLQLGADGALVIGTQFTLELSATSGSILKTASAPATVVNKPGDFDLSFGGSGLVNGPSGVGNGGGARLDGLREVAGGRSWSPGALPRRSPGAATSSPGSSATGPWTSASAAPGR